LRAVANGILQRRVDAGRSHGSRCRAGRRPYRGQLHAIEEGRQLRRRVHAAVSAPQRASTVALAALVDAELGQTLLDSRAPLVVLTAAGSLAAMGTLISIPVVSQLLGCTPLGPLGWAQALGAAGAATGAIAVVNAVSESWGTSDKEPPDPNTAPDAASDGSPQSPPRPRATAAHKAAALAPSAQKLPSKLSDRPGRRSSTYVRR
jgi:cation-transporting P-type ATPase I